MKFTGERFVPEVHGNIELEHLHRYLLVSKVVVGKTVLDIASGEGYGSAMLARTAHKVTGVDISQEAVSHAQAKYKFENLDFRLGSCSAIPLEDASVDIVVSFETIEHHNEHDAMMREIKRILRPGGVLVISSPDKLEYTDKSGTNNPHHVKELYRDEFKKLLDSYFKKHCIYGQRVLYGSAIFCEDNASKVESYHIADKALSPIAGIPHAVYLIAVASDTELPLLTSGVLEQCIENSDISQIWQEQLVNRDWQIANLNHVVTEQRSQIANLNYIVSEQHSQIAERDLQITNKIMVIAKKNTIINRIYSSYSWRLTRPLRLLAIRQKYLHWKLGIASKLNAISSSPDNLLALQALSLRRFDKQALLTAIGVIQPDEWPEIDISVVAYNSSRWVEPFVASLASQRYPLSKIHLRFVDHGSQDDTILQVEKFLVQTAPTFASTQIIKQANLGFGAGHDRAIREGNSKYCLVTNLDLEFTPDSLCDVVRVALSDKDGGVASWELRQIPFEHPKYYDPVTLETNWSSHACVLIRRSAYTKVGGYDRNIFMYAEDVELSYRFRSYGYVLKYVPSAVVKHFTYENAVQIKPLQYSGSMLGNIFIRLRYGKRSDQLAGLLLYADLFSKPALFENAKNLLFQNAFKLLFKAPHFLRGRGAVLAYFPLRKFDYEMTRDGAFWESLPCPSADTPLVTVITRTYKGRGMFLEQAMQSVFNQTYPTIELIVVEDGGDSQKTLVTSIAERVPSGCIIRFLANEKLGRSAAGNAALAEANGHFIMFLDDDDLLFSDHVETLVSALSCDTKLSAAYALSVEVHTNVDTVKLTYVEDSFHSHANFRQEWDYDVLLHYNFIPIQAILFKRELYEKRGGFDMELDQLEDWNLWLRYGYGNKFKYIPKTTSIFRTPADDEMRSARHGLLIAAHGDAKERAMNSLEELGLL
jgi:GT2 family glycosyltransferase/SAM-dependent methyltransferase